MADRPPTPRPSSLTKSVVLCALVMGCNACDKSPTLAQQPPQPTEGGPTISPSDGTASLPVPPGEEVSFDEALAVVQRVRGLKKKAEVQGLLVDRVDLADHLRRALKFERPESVLEGTEQMLVGLGLVPTSFDLEATMIDLLDENLAGLYEPRLGLMMVRKDLPEETRRITLLHELVHALQDQYFDLDEIVTAHPDDSDKSSALSCLAEGDATSAMLDGVLPEGKTALDLPEGSIEAQFFAQAPKTNAPDLIIRSLYAPYLDGLGFVHTLRRRGGFAEVNRVFAAPPISTEQVLHVDKYDAGEQPIAVATPGPPGPGFEELLHDVWGEQSLRLALEEWLPPSEARRAAAGWGGDRIVAYKKGDQIAVAWEVVWDDEGEAVEIWDLLVHRPGTTDIESQPASDSAETAPPPICLESKVGGPTVLVARQDSRIIWLSAPFVRGTPNRPCTAAAGWLETLLVRNTPE